MHFDSKHINFVSCLENTTKHGIWMVHDHDIGSQARSANQAGQVPWGVGFCGIRTTWFGLSVCTGRLTLHPAGNTSFRVYIHTTIHLPDFLYFILRKTRHYLRTYVPQYTWFVCASVYLTSYTTSAGNMSFLVFIHKTIHLKCLCVYQIPIPKNWNSLDKETRNAPTVRIHTYIHRYIHTRHTFEISVCTGPPTLNPVGNTSFHVYTHTTHTLICLGAPDVLNYIPRVTRHPFYTYIPQYIDISVWTRPPTLHPRSCG